jgi:hypothetical protein
MSAITPTCRRPGRAGWPAVLRRLALAVLLPCLGVAGGCATYLQAQVTSFHQGTEELRLAGKRFVVEPTDAQKDSLEFQAYADLVRRALVEKGLVAAGNDARPDLIVRISYGIDNGRPVVYGYPAYGYTHYGPVWTWTPYPVPGGGVRYVWTPTYPMTYGVVGTHYSEATIYRRELRVVIHERGNGAAGARVYEGTVVTEGGSGSLAPVMPSMVRALFSDFPGRNGQTRIVQVPIEQQPGGPAPAPKGSGQPADPATQPNPPPAG